MITDTKNKRLYFLLILVISIGIALQMLIYKIAIIALLLQWLISKDYKQKIININREKLGLGLIVFFALYATSFLWSENKSVAITDTILKLPLLLMPLLMLSQKSLLVKQINQVFLFFAVGSVLINLICFVDAYFSFGDTNQTKEFYYSNLVVNMHPAYQSMFTCFSIVLFVYLFVKEKFISNWVTYILVAIQIIFVLLFSSRMQILIMMVITPCFLVLFHYRKKKTLLGIFYTLVVFGLGYFVIKMPSTLNYRYNQTVSQISSIGIDHYNIDHRKIIWKEGLKVIKKNWFLGSGSGDAKDNLVTRFSKLIVDDIGSDVLVDSTLSEVQKNKKVIRILKEEHLNNNVNYEDKLRNYSKSLLEGKNHVYKTSYHLEYNFHNQYLQTFAEIGVFGLLILCLLLAYPLIFSFKKKDYLTISFLFIIGSSFLTESMLERQAGVVFFAFFYVFLIGRLARIDPLDSSV